MMVELGMRHALFMIMESGEATESVTPNMTAVLSMTGAACGCALLVSMCMGLTAATDAPTANGAWQVKTKVSQAVLIMLRSFL